MSTKPYDDESLIRSAQDAMKNAHAPYSGVRVGAALLGKSGTIHTGCNIENASYGLSICAERVALGCAIKSGEKKFSAIAIANSSHKAFPPCGACRQAFFEFSPDMNVIIVSSSNEIQTFSLRELLPTPFTMSD